MGPHPRPLLAATLALGGCTVTLPFDTLTGGLRPVAIYHFEEGIGQTAKDELGRNEAVVQHDEVEPTWTKSGKRGGGISFPTGDGSIYVPTLSGTNAPQRGTVALWVDMRTVTAEGAQVFVLEEDNNANDETDDVTALGVFVKPAGVVLQYQQVGAQPAFFSTPSGLEIGRWTLLVVGWDVAARQAYVYARPAGQPAMPIQRARFPDGFAVEQASFYFSAPNGTLDEVSVYDRMLPEGVLDRLE